MTCPKMIGLVGVIELQHYSNSSKYCLGNLSRSLRLTPAMFLISRLGCLRIQMSRMRTLIAYCTPYSVPWKRTLNTIKTIFGNLRLTSKPFAFPYFPDFQSYVATFWKTPLFQQSRLLL